MPEVGLHYEISDSFGSVSESVLYKLRQPTTLALMRNIIKSPRDKYMLDRKRCKSLHEVATLEVERGNGISV